MLNRKSKRQVIVLASCAGLLGLTLPGGELVAQDIVLANGAVPTKLYEVNLALNEVNFLQDIQSEQVVHALTFCPGDDRLLFIGRDGGTVGAVNLDTQVETVLGKIPAGKQTVQLACGADGLLYFSDNFTEELFTLNLDNCDGVVCPSTLLGTVETAQGLGDVDIQGADLQFTLSGQLLLLTNGPSNAPDPRLYSIALPCVGFCQANDIGSVVTGDANTGVAVLPDGRLIVSNRDDELYEIDPTDATVLTLGQLSEAGQTSVFNILGGDLAARRRECPSALDFETDGTGAPLVPGQIIDDEFASLGITLVTNDPVNHPLMIFDSSAPTGDDPDLGTPNVDFAGPGIGAGGGAASPGRNGLPRGQILIVSDGNPSDPNDIAGGGDINFLFDPPVQLVTEVHVLDIDNGESGGTVTAFDAVGAEILTRPLLELGNNSFQAVPIGAFNVGRLEIHLPSSGAVSGIVFCAQCGANIPPLDN
ncbi:MAG: hypothetical protein OEQ39_24440 [Gammaproteobacteria bacterium]|nr:hypothetical protein [Gammaproteobacteria bacterium]MDH3469123.1 hypothetical protein [Gammaproteobacteria bacterium]